MEKFKVIIVEDDKLELKGTQQILQTEVPEAEIIGTASGESEFWKLLREGQPDLVLLDLGLGGSTTVGVDICRQLRSRYADMKILVFTGEILNERLWVDVLGAGADGIILKTGNLLQRDDVMQVMHGRHLVFNEPFLEKVMARFRKVVCKEQAAIDAFVEYEIDEYDGLATDALQHEEPGEAAGRPHQPSLLRARAERRQCRATRGTRHPAPHHRPRQPCSR